MKLSAAQVRARARDIELLVLDVDGVLTDGGLYYGPEGEALKRFNVRDGHGLVLARAVGLRAAILTARRSKIVELRGTELGVSPISQGNRDKARGFVDLLELVGLPAAKVAYVGDDVNDLPALKAARLAACPCDAAPEVLRAAHFVTRAKGGHGAVREVVELVLKARGLWAQALSTTLPPPPPR